MKKNVEVELDISGEDMAKELWHFNTVEQMSFLLELARIYRFNLSDFSMQLEYLSDEINSSYYTSEKDAIIRVLEKVLEYIRGDEE